MYQQYTNDNTDRKLLSLRTLIISHFFHDKLFCLVRLELISQKVDDLRVMKSRTACMHGDGRTSFTVRAFFSSQHTLVTGRRQDMVVCAVPFWLHLYEVLYLRTGPFFDLGEK